MVALGTILEVEVTVKNEGIYPESFDVSLYYDGNLIDTQSVTNLASKTTKVISFNWDTGGVTPGYDYTLTAIADVVPGEKYTDDNTKSSSEPVKVGEPATIKVQPAVYDCRILNDTVSLEITVSNLKSYWRVVGVQVRVWYNSTLLEFINATEGLFLKSFAVQQPGSLGTVFSAAHDENPPWGPSILVGVLILPNSTGMWNPPFPEGNGTVATLNFKSLYQERGLQKPPLTFEIALTQTDMFDDEGVTILYSVEGGVFNMWPTHIADINYDGKVDLKDYFTIVAAFGETPSRPRWNPIADLNSDGKIDLKDVYTCATGFGWTAQ